MCVCVCVCVCVYACVLVTSSRRISLERVNEQTEARSTLFWSEVRTVWLTNPVDRHCLRWIIKGLSRRQRPHEESNEVHPVIHNDLDCICVLSFRLLNMRHDKCNYYFASERGATYCDEYVCLAVCLSVRSHTSKTTWPTFTKLLCMMPDGVARDGGAKKIVGGG